MASSLIYHQQNESDKNAQIDQKNSLKKNEPPKMALPSLPTMAPPLTEPPPLPSSSLMSFTGAPPLPQRQLPPPPLPPRTPPQRPPPPTKTETLKKELRTNKILKNTEKSEKKPLNGSLLSYNSNDVNINTRHYLHRDLIGIN